MGELWTEQAECKNYPLSIFYPEPGQYGGDRAREICSTCPVKSECLEFAIETRQEHGIWAGMTARERQAFEDKRARQSRAGSGRMNGTRRC